MPATGRASSTVLILAVPPSAQDIQGAARADDLPNNGVNAEPITDRADMGGNLRGGGGSNHGVGHLGNPSVRLGPIPLPVRVMPQYADRCKGFFRPARRRFFGWWHERGSGRDREDWCRLDRLAQAVEDPDGNWEDTVTDLGFVMTALLVSHDNAEHRMGIGGHGHRVMQAARDGLDTSPASAGAPMTYRAAGGVGGMSAVEQERGTMFSDRPMSAIRLATGVDCDLCVVVASASPSTPGSSGFAVSGSGTSPQAIQYLDGGADWWWQYRRFMPGGRAMTYRRAAFAAASAHLVSGALRRLGPRCRGRPRKLLLGSGWLKRRLMPPAWR